MLPSTGRPGPPTGWGAALQVVEPVELALMMITNRGVKVWPDGFPETFCTHHWRCRYMAEDGRGVVKYEAIIGLLRRLAAAGFDAIKAENLYTFDGEPGFSHLQGQ